MFQFKSSACLLGCSSLSTTSPSFSLYAAASLSPGAWNSGRIASMALPGLEPACLYKRHRVFSAALHPHHGRQGQREPLVPWLHQESCDLAPTSGETGETGAPPSTSAIQCAFRWPLQKAGAQSRRSGPRVPAWFSSAAGSQCSGVEL